MIKWFPRLILMVIAVVVIALIVRHYANRDVDGSEVSRAAYIARLYYDDIIMYTDEETKRVYPGIVDREKFTAERLEQFFEPRSSLIGVGSIASRLELVTAGETIVIYTDQKTYEQYIGFAQAGVMGRGSGTYETLMLPVSVRTGNDLGPGTLNITVVRTGGRTEEDSATPRETAPRGSIQ